MESSSRFRFRDHRDAEVNSSDSDDTSVVTSASYDKDDDDDDSHLESMTAKGIKRLCTELLEIKAASDEDFHKNIFADYTAFVGIFEEVQEMEKELIQLRTHVVTQKRLVKELTDGIYRKVLSEESIESVIQESENDEQPPSDELEAHIDSVSDNLDMLLAENSIDEAIAVLEVEEAKLHGLQLEDDNLLDVSLLYETALSGRKAMLTLQLTLVAENPRIAAVELQKALVRLCRLGNSDLATQLLIKYYHSRLETGIRSLQSLKSFIHGAYTRELSKFVFSMISQAARSFVMLNGETSAYASEFIQWVCEEIENFSVCFTKYLKSISEISGGLTIAVEGVQFAVSYCSLLEAQRLMLQPCLINNIRFCMEEVLQAHAEHVKKVICIFTATDSWVLGRYLVSGLLNETYTSMIVGQQPKYCLLTNSGRKFVILLQAITDEVIPLVALEMQVSILKVLVNLFMEYITILEKAIAPGAYVPEKSSFKIVSAESLPQQVSILANLSTLEKLFSGTITCIFGSINHADSELIKNQLVDSGQQELDHCLLLIEEASTRLRDNFFQQFIYRIISLDTGSKLTIDACIDAEGDPCLAHNVTPSPAFQVFFLELRKLDELAEDNVFEMNWLMELSRELIEGIFVWISNNKETWQIDADDLAIQHSDAFNQFVLDMHFLLEITRFGNYFTENPSVPATLMKSAFVSAGLDPESCSDDEWAIRAANEAIQMLLQIEKTESCSNDGIIGNHVDEQPDNQSEHASEIAEDDVSGSSESPTELEEHVVSLSSDLPKDKGFLVDRNARNSTETSGDLDDIESEKEAYDKFHFGLETNLPDSLLPAGFGEVSKVGLPSKEGVQSKYVVGEILNDKPEDDAQTRLPGAEIASGKD